jgi:hypothetical protein
MIVQSGSRPHPGTPGATNGSQDHRCDMVDDVPVLARQVDSDFNVG